MTIQEQLIEALRGLGLLDQHKVLEFARRLHRDDPGPESVYARAKRLGVVGIVADAPPDLSTDKRHLLGFGRD
jgi:hypothetical protein